MRCGNLSHRSGLSSDGARRSAIAPQIRGPGTVTAAPSSASHTCDGLAHVGRDANATTNPFCVMSPSSSSWSSSCSLARSSGFVSAMVSLLRCLSSGGSRDGADAVEIIQWQSATCHYNDTRRVEATRRAVKGNARVKNGQKEDQWLEQTLSSSAWNPTLA